MPMILPVAGALLLGAGAVVGAVAATAVVAGIALSTILTVTGVALMAVGYLTAPKPKPQSTGQQLELKVNPDQAIPVLYGRSAAGGAMVWRGTWGAKNKFLGVAALISMGGPIAGIEQFRAGDYPITFSGSPAYSAAAVSGVGDYGTSSKLYRGKLWQRWLPGEAPASQDYAQATGQPFPAGKVSGAAIALTWYEQSNDAFPQGIPASLWVARGVKLYDPRKDSTYPGGLGNHRVANPATWEFSENPFLAGLQWALGRWENNKKVYGIGARWTEVDVASFVTGANVADANNWKVGGVVTTSDDKFAVLGSLLAAGGGVPIARGGQISCAVNAPKTSVLNLTQDDVIGEVNIQSSTGWRDRSNTIIPKYREETQNWQIIAGERVSAQQYITEDGGETKTVEVEYPLVQQAKQAHQLATYELCNSREFLTFNVVTKLRMLSARVGDCITVQLPDLAASSVKCQIIAREFTSDLSVTLSLKSETDAKHAFALGQSQVAPPAPALDTFDPSNPGDPEASSWSITDTAIQAENGEVVPALIVNGDNENPFTADILVDYRPLGSADWIDWGAFASDTRRFEIASVTSGTQYQVGIRYRTVHGVTTGRLVLGPVTAGLRQIDYDTQVIGTPDSLGQINQEEKAQLDQANVVAHQANSTATAATEALRDPTSGHLYSVEAIVRKQEDFYANIPELRAIGDVVANAASKAAATQILSDAVNATATEVATIKADAETIKSQAEAAAAEALAFSLDANVALNQARSAVTLANTATSAAQGHAAAALASSNAATTARNLAQTNAITATSAAAAASASSNSANAALVSAQAQASNALTARNQANTAMVAAANSANAAAGFLASSQIAATNSLNNAITAAGHASTAGAANTATQAARAAAEAAANQANTSASNASSSAGLAVGARDASQIAAGAAVLSASNAAASASNAAGSASTATQQAGVATSARNAANTAANSAATSAQQSSSSANAAGQSASSASDSATIAQTQAGSAATFAQSASNAANSAQGSETNASTSAGLATSAKNAAGASANAAALSSQQASSSANAAGTSAGVANQSAIAAQANSAAAGVSAQQAAQASQTANSAASAANASSGVAATSALAAQSSAAVLFPGDFPADANQWVLTDAPLTTTAVISGHASYSAGPASFFWDRSKSGQYQELRTRGWVPWTAGQVRRYRCEITCRWSTLPTVGSANLSMGMRGGDANYSYTGWAGRGYLTPTEVMATYSFVIDDIGHNAATTVRTHPCFQIGGVTGQNGILEVQSIRITDVTSEVAAAGSASAAATSASSAETSANAAGTSASAANQSAVVAASNAAAAGSSASQAAKSETNAAGSAATSTNQANIATARATHAQQNATAAATSAAAASSSANSAGTSASVANQSAIAAQANSAAAGVSAQQAATASQTANAASSAANTASGVASTSALAARNTVNSAPLLPSRFTDKAFFAQNTDAIDLAVGSLVQASGEGQVLELGSRVIITTRGWVPSGTGRTLRMTVRWRTTVDAPNNDVHVGFLGYYGDGTYRTTHSWQTRGIGKTVAEGWVEQSYTMTSAQAGTSVFIRPAIAPNGNGSPTSSGATAQIAMIRIDDITEMVAAEGSASAAATSASSAETAANTAGQYASASQSSAILAATNAAAAGSSASQAAKSETNAAGSASQSSANATLAGTRAGYAGSNAAAAATSAQQANSSANAAGQQATIATQSANFANANAAIAGGFANQAAQASQTANAAMAAANSSSGISATAALDAQKSLKAAIPLADVGPVNVTQYCRNSGGGSPEAASDWYGGNQVINAAGELSLEMLTDGFYSAWKKVVPATIGRTYRFEVDAEPVSTLGRLQVFPRFLASDYALVTTAGQPGTTVTARAIYTMDVTLTVGNVGSSVWMRPSVKCLGNDGGIRLYAMRVYDVTELLANQASASAAATSASAASSSANTAGQQAEVSTQQAQFANTNAATAGSFANSAQSASTNAAGSASAANTSAATALTRANWANANAAAAQTSATLANSSANAAGTQANIATQSATIAAANAAIAGGYANQAAGASQTANAASASANSASGVAATASLAAQRATTFLFPSDFRDEGLYFARSQDGDSPASITTSSVDSFPIDPVYGKVYQQQGSGTSWSTRFATKGYINLVAGRKYRAEALIRITNAGTTTNYNVTMVQRLQKPDFSNRVDYSSGTRVNAPANTLGAWVQISQEFTAESAMSYTTGWAYARPYVSVSGTVGNGNTSAFDGILQVAYFTVADITESAAAGASASAAATSASSASSNATTAMQQANAASNSAVVANTAAGQAGVFSNSASAAANTSTAASQQASSSAGVAAASAGLATTTVSMQLPSGFQQDGLHFSNSANGQTPNSITSGFRTLPVAAAVYYPDAAWIASNMNYTRSGSGATAIGSTGAITTVDANTARIGYYYEGGRWAPAGVMSEVSRTNFLRYSLDISNAAWTKSVSTVTNTAGAGLDGQAGIVHNSTGVYSQLQQRNLTCSANTQYTYSAIVKPITGDFYTLLVTSTAGPSGYVQFNLANGTIIGHNGGAANSMHQSSRIAPFGAGYYKIEMTLITGADVTQITPTLWMGNYNSNSTSGQSVAVAGAQFENGSYATSLINTTTGSVTRMVDRLYQPVTVSPTAMTTLLRFRLDALTTATQTIWEIDSGTNTNRIIAYVSSSNRLSLQWHVNGATGISIGNVNVVAGAWYNLAIGYDMATATLRFAHNDTTYERTLSGNFAPFTMRRYGASESGGGQLAGTIVPLIRGVSEVSRLLTLEEMLSFTSQ